MNGGFLGGIVKRATTGALKMEDVADILDRLNMNGDEYTRKWFFNWNTGGHIKLLDDCMSRPFNLGKFTSLEEIISNLEVQIKLVPGTDTATRGLPAELSEMETYWTEEIDRLKSNGSSSNECEVTAKILEEIKEEKGNWGTMKLRGCYVREEKTILLYPDVMAEEYEGERMPELIISTLVYEIMHAYFDRPGRKCIPYNPLVEEPLAGFGMLLFLNSIDDSAFYSWAFEDVSMKQTCYSRGAKLVKKYLEDTTGNAPIRNFFEAYKNYPDYSEFYKLLAQ